MNDLMKNARSQSLQDLMSAMDEDEAKRVPKLMIKIVEDENGNLSSEDISGKEQEPDQPQEPESALAVDDGMPGEGQFMELLRKKKAEGMNGRY